MKKIKWTPAAIIVETIIILCGLVYSGMQLFYGINYGIPVYKYLANILIVVLIYVCMTILAEYPEKINNLSPEACTGKIRKDSVWMLRWIKLVFIGSLMIPCVADALGIEIRSAYSAITILLIAGIAIFFECRILMEIRRRNNRKDQ